MEFSNCILYVLAIWAFYSVNIEANPTTSTTSAPLTEYHLQPQEAASAYVPHTVYPYADRYGPDSQVPFDSYLYSAPNYPLQASNYMSSLVPSAQHLLQASLRLFAKVGLFLIGGVTLLLVGGVFTTAVCSLTPICTITFSGLGGLDKETVRSLMTPDNISATATLVKDAIGKYQRLQRAIHST